MTEPTQEEVKRRREERLRILLDPEFIKDRVELLRARDLEIPEFHAIQLQLADVIELLSQSLATTRKDAGRIDWLETAIRDGSYASIINDIVAMCQHAYANIGPGPALRSSIDAAFALSSTQEKGE